MHITLHLTNDCNMNCSYCYSPPCKQYDMNYEIIEKAIYLSTKLKPANTGIIFFGGEPLLRKELIQKTVNLCQENESKYGYSYHFKITTNGLLLDRSFLEFAEQSRIHVALSVDGIEEAHDTHRKTKGGKGTFSRVEKKISRLLSFQPYASALMTVTPETVHFYSESFSYLIEKGFRYVIASLNYAGAWNENHLKILKTEYKKIAKMYEKLTLEEKKIYFSPFEKKIASHIQGKDALCLQCHFGIKQISIAPDGTIFPCVQFVKSGQEKTFAIGDVWNGIDAEKQQALYKLSRKTKSVCDECALNFRCEHRCSCLNWQTTGKIDAVSPILCETEKILIPVADKLGESLYKKKVPFFIQKNYNPIYPVISYLEDTIVTRG